MAGDAGAGQLNPTDRDPAGRDTPDAAGDDGMTEAGTTDAGTAVGGTEAVGTGADGTDRAADGPGGPDAAQPEVQIPAAEPDPADPPSRLGHGALLAVCAALAVLIVGLGAVGVAAWRLDRDSQSISAAERDAVAAAIDCVAATQAPDAAAMAASQARIVACATGDFGAQASMMAGVILEAYQAADVLVQVDDIRAAVERHHEDGSIDVLVAVNTRVTNVESADVEQGYRLRVTMARDFAEGSPDPGAFRIARLEQVSA